MPPFPLAQSLSCISLARRKSNFTRAVSENWTHHCWTNSPSLITKRDETHQLTHRSTCCHFSWVSLKPTKTPLSLSLLFCLVLAFQNFTLSGFGWGKILIIAASKREKRILFSGAGKFGFLFCNLHPWRLLLGDVIMVNEFTSCFKKQKGHDSQAPLLGT